MPLSRHNWMQQSMTHVHNSWNLLCQFWRQWLNNIESAPENPIKVPLCQLSVFIPHQKINPRYLFPIKELIAIKWEQTGSLHDCHYELNCGLKQHANFERFLERGSLFEHRNKHRNTETQNAAKPLNIWFGTSMWFGTVNIIDIYLHLLHWHWSTWWRHQMETFSA